MANDFFGIQNAMELLGFRTRPLREHDAFTTRAAASSAQGVRGDAEKAAPVKSFDEFLTEAKEKTRDMSLDEFKAYVNEVLASLQADKAQREDLSAVTLQNQMQLSRLYTNLLQNSLLSTGTSSLNGDDASSFGNLDLSAMATTALASLSTLNSAGGTSLYNGLSLDGPTSYGTLTGIANALTNAQTIQPTASADGTLTALLASGMLNTGV